MSASSFGFELEQPSPLAPVATREIALEDDALIDLCVTVRGVAEKALEDPRNTIENTLILEGIRHQNKYTTPGIVLALRGTPLSNLELTLWRNDQGKEQVKIVATDQDHPDRRITFSESGFADMMLIHDNRHERVAQVNRATEMAIPKAEVAHWLAVQVTHDATSAQKILEASPTPLYEATRLLESRAATKHVIDVAAVALLTGTVLTVQNATSRNAVDPLGLPMRRRYSAWLTSSLPEYFVPTDMPWLTQRLIVSFCPETGVVVPTNEDTSVRLELETDPKVNGESLDALLSQTAQKAEGTIVETFKKVAVSLGVNPTQL